MNPMLGAAAMSLSSFTVCMNALRLNLFKMHNTKHDHKLKNSVKIDRDAIIVETKKATESMVIEVAGMMCGHCETSVRKALEKIDGIDQAQASFEEGTVVLTLSSSVDENLIREAVEDEDYEYKGIKA